MARRLGILLVLAVVATGTLLQRDRLLRRVEETARQERENYSEIEEGLWMGGLVERPPPGTRAVLNLCEMPDEYESEVHRWEAIRDAPPAPPLGWLDARVEFVETQRAAGRPVYVHCFAGVSRSGMVVVASLMRRHGWTRDEALAYVRTRRPEIRPNPAFMERLLEWELTLDGAAVAETP